MGSCKMQILFTTNHLEICLPVTKKGQRTKAAVNMYKHNQEQTMGMSSQELDDALIDGLTSMLMNAGILEEV
jgi:hypothetical protein